MDNEIQFVAHRARGGVESAAEVAMIPTMILLGLVLGRWWRTALLAGAIIWPVIVVSDDSIGVSVIPAAAMLGVLNAAAGVVVTQAVLWLVRSVRHRPVRAH